MAKSPEDRGILAQWMREQRLARGWKIPDVLAELAKQRASITETTYRGYEASGPSRPIKRALEAIYGQQAPNPKTQKERAGDVPALVEALRDQTAAINGLVAELRAMRLSGSQDEEELRAEVDTLLRANRPDDEPHPPPSDTPT